MRLSLLFIFSFFGLSLSAQVENGRNYGLFFVGVDFHHWPSLHPVSDQVLAIAQSLQDVYGFEIEVITYPTESDILNVLKTYGQKTFQAKDQLLIYFGMHGFYEPGKSSGLIPTEGALDGTTPREWINYSHLEELVNNIPCDHILLSLDASTSDVFGPTKSEAFKLPAWKSNQNCWDHKASLLKAKSRVYLTNGAYNRKNPNADFTEKWLDLLDEEWEEGTFDFQSLLEGFQELDPKPTFGSFGMHEEDGTFIWSKKDSCSSRNLITDEEEWQQMGRDRDNNSVVRHLQLFPKCGHEKLILEQFSLSREAAEQQNFFRNMAFIRGGTFQMGDATEDYYHYDGPVHPVTVSDFYLGRYEVTFADYDTFCLATGRELPKDQGWGREDRPVINVSWFDAVAYCNWLSTEDDFVPVYTFEDKRVIANWEANGYRLPTEAEWEYAACSGATNYRYPWGNEPEPNANLLDEYAAKAHDRGVIERKGYQDGYIWTAPVGQFQQGGFGLFDMAGNVWEWCWDVLDVPGHLPARESRYYSLKSSSKDPKGYVYGTQRTVRGGSWFDDSLMTFECGVRLAVIPEARKEVIGFRLCRNFE
ncbi:MAG: formylglycine-generating enzyme family protein [Saprospiraceae bacterium]|nr:formylglycine-generating enzyme family protein [Lewinella sp.]